MNLDLIILKAYFGVILPMDVILCMVSETAIIEVIGAVSALFTSVIGGIVLYYKALSDHAKAKAEAEKMRAEAIKMRLENERIRQEIAKSIDPPGTGSDADPGRNPDSIDPR